jgi:hypothetical protein
MVAVVARHAVERKLFRVVPHNHAATEVPENSRIEFWMIHGASNFVRNLRGALLTLN